jgi:hypothetical protein
VPIYRNLWDHIGKQMPKKGRGKAGELDPFKLPNELQTALYALYGHYEKIFEEWKRAAIEVFPSCAICRIADRRHDRASPRPVRKTADGSNPTTQNLSRLPRICGGNYDQAQPMRAAPSSAPY